MTDLFWTQEPELLGLMQEIARDPRSSLFSAPLRPWTAQAGTGEPLSTRHLDATTAERHLVDCFREETAQLLRRAFALIAAETERGKLYFSRADFPGVPRDPADLVALRGRFSTLLRSERFNCLPSPVIELIGLMARDLQSPEELVGPIQKAAEALVPHEISLVQAGLTDLMLAPGSQETQDGLLHVAMKVTSPALRSVALNNAAEAAVQSSRIHDAIGLCRASLEYREGNSLAALALLATSWAGGDERGLLQAAEIVDGELGPDHPAVKLSNARSKTRRSLGVRTNSDEQIGTISDEAITRLGPASRMVLTLPL